MATEVFAFLFKYRPFYFQKGDLTFQPPLSVWLLLVVLMGIGALLYFAYRRKWWSVGNSVGWTLFGFRTAFFLVLALMLMRPTLVLSTLVPGENLMAVIVDNSASMGLREQGEPRGEQVGRLLQAGAAFRDQLEERFIVRSFRFDVGVERMDDPSELDWSGEKTDIAGALERVVSELRHLPLGGVVLFSDGSDNSARDFREVLSELKTRQIPVHTVGIGPERLERDVEVVQVSAPRRILPEGTAAARVTLRHYGFGGRQAHLRVREGTTLVETQEIVLPRDSDTFTVDLNLVPQSEGVQTYRFSVDPLEGEEIVENNQRLALIEVRDSRPRILYVEGQPRWEYKFIRQSLIEDRHLRLETLLRTSLNRFYRQGIEEESILAEGFPNQKEELFAYQGMILGNIESSFFTFAQMEMIRDFVGRRGGGFLMLGGNSSFAAGAYQNTPVEEILPVWLPEEPSGLSRVALYGQGEAQVRLSDRGLLHPALQLSMQQEENRRLWEEMPPLTDWNFIGGTKSGSTVLARLEGASEDRSEERPLLAFQRYGRGHSISLLSGSVWRWQMLKDHRDQSHQTFWRQILRWLVSHAGDPVNVETEREVYSRHDVVRIRSEVHDQAFNRVNDARVAASLISPGGTAHELALQWNPREDGIYTAEWQPTEEGLYRIDVQAKSRTREEEYGSATSWFLAAAADQEYFNAVQNRELLQTLSAETGGEYYSLADAHRLPEEAVYTESESSVVESRDLWDMPVNFFLLLGLLMGEWILRKRHGSI